jgi:hypothetical protein
MRTHRRNRSVALLLILLGCVLPLPARPLLEDVEGVLRTRLEGIAARDGDLLRSVLAAGGNVTMVIYADGRRVVTRQTHGQYIASISRDGRPLREQVSNLEIQTTAGGMAHAWMDYEAYVGGRLHHCGINSIDLIVTDEGWRIESQTITVRMEGCGGAGNAPHGGGD